MYRLILYGHFVLLDKDWVIFFLIQEPRQLASNGRETDYNKNTLDLCILAVVVLYKTDWQLHCIEIHNLVFDEKHTTILYIVYLERENIWCIVNNNVLMKKNTTEKKKSQNRSTSESDLSPKNKKRV